MKPKNIGILSDKLSDLYMLEWTIQYLSGQPEYSVLDREEYIVQGIPSDVELFVPNRVFVPQVFDFQFDQLCKQETPVNTISAGMYLDSPEATSYIIDTMQSSCDCVVVVNYTGLPKFFKDITAANEYMGLYFSDSLYAYQEEGLTNTWDMRELLAMNMNPYATRPNLIDHIDRTKQTFNMSATEYYLTFDLTVSRLFSYLGLDIDQSRFDNWLTVYKRWQDAYRKEYVWKENVENAVECIVNGWNLDLTTFDIDLVKEATLQHLLITRHNLTLKSWGIERLPPNTADIHKLLEPNFHVR